MTMTTKSSPFGLLRQLLGCACLVLLLLTPVNAECSGECDVQVVGNASCLPAIIGAALEGDLAEAARRLKYGKYCGNNNECLAVPNGTDIAPEDADSRCIIDGQADCLPEACGPVDQACLVQQECLGAIRSDPNATSE